MSFSGSQRGRCLNVCDKSVAVVGLYFGDVCGQVQGLGNMDKKIANGRFSDTLCYRCTPFLSGCNIL